MHPSSPVQFEQISSISNEEEFTAIALKIFRDQFQNLPVYREYCQMLGRTNPKQLFEIPFLPIEFFKSHGVIDPRRNFQTVFKSSGTSGAVRSNHYVADLKIYEQASQRAFELFFGALDECIVLALLPNYIQQGESSLVYMVNHFINQSKNEKSGFYLNDLNQLLKTITTAKNDNKKIILFGVSYALLDLAEQQVDLSKIVVIETGGMKGRRKEMPKEALHEALQKGLNLDAIYSEYGMTELLSQAYCKNDEPFVSPPWMKILIREENDPFSFHALSSQATGGISVIDLANIHSCAFIHTQDLGRYQGSGFKLLGRYDNSDIRGCNQLVFG